jgi:PAT family beta-lactamase induction signal transducer AmpG
LTEKRFSATQYALLSSIFAIGRTISGPIAGVLADAMGWRNFFLLTIAAAVPGMIMLQRFVPLGMRDPQFVVETKSAGAPLRKRAVLARAIAGTVAGVAVGALSSASLGALRAMRQAPGTGLDLRPYLENLVNPASAAHVTSSAAVLLFAVSCGLGWAALAVGRRGLRTDAPGADGAPPLH